MYFTTGKMLRLAHAMLKPNGYLFVAVRIIILLALQGLNPPFRFFI
jgi:hypothetical protein